MSLSDDMLAENTRLTRATHEAVVGLCAREEARERRLSTVEKVVFGNGTPGLKGKVASLMEAHGSRKVYMRLVIAAILAEAAGGVAVGIAYLIKHAT